MTKTKTQRITFKVTKKIIKSSQPYMPEECMLAQAIKPHLKAGFKPCVGAGNVSITRKGDTVEGTQQKLPAGAEKKRSQFDHGDGAKLKGFTFTLRLPVSVLKTTKKVVKKAAK